MQTYCLNVLWPHMCSTVAHGLSEMPQAHCTRWISLAGGVYLPWYFHSLVDDSSPCPPLSQGSMLLVRMAREAEVRQALQPVPVFSESPEKLLLPSPSASSVFSHLAAWLLQG